MYATVNEFLTFLREQELVEQSNWEPSGLFVNQDFADMHLQFANAKINGALAVRFTVPIIPSPPQLKYICMRVAHWSMEQLGEIRQHIQTHYEQAIVDLDKLVKGESSLIGADGKPIQPIVDVVEPGDFGDRVYTSVAQRGFFEDPIYFGVIPRKRPIDGECRF